MVSIFSTQKSKIKIEMFSNHPSIKSREKCTKWILVRRRIDELNYFWKNVSDSLVNWKYEKWIFIRTGGIQNFQQLNVEIASMIWKYFFLFDSFNFELNDESLAKSIDSKSIVKFINFSLSSSVYRRREQQVLESATTRRTHCVVVAVAHRITFKSRHVRNAAIQRQRPAHVSENTQIVKFIAKLKCRCLWRYAKLYEIAYL